MMAITSDEVRVAQSQAGNGESCKERKKDDNLSHEPSNAENGKCSLGRDGFHAGGGDGAREHGSVVWRTADGERLFPLKKLN